VNFLLIWCSTISREFRGWRRAKTASFARFPGGGLATTALVAANSGTPTKVIARVGRDALASPEWQKLVRRGISTEGCEFDQRLPTAMTVSAAFDGDRMMVTHNIINVKLERLLRRSGVQRVRNGRALEDLALDDAVELPCQVSSHGVQVPPVGHAPEAVRPLLLQVKEYERLTVRASVKHSREVALAALEKNPLVGRPEVAQRVLTE